MPEPITPTEVTNETPALSIVDDATSIIPNEVEVINGKKQNEQLLESLKSPEPINKPEPPSDYKIINTRGSVIGFKVDTVTDGTENKTKSTSTVQASVITYDSRLITVESGLLVPHSSRFLRLKTETSQVSDSDDFRAGSTSSKRNMNKNQPSDQNKKRKVGREAILTSKTLNLNSSSLTTHSEPLLVPIKLNIDIGDFKLKDAFLWDFNEANLTPANFASILCSDLNLTTSPFQQLIEDAINEQLAHFHSIHSEIKQCDSVFRQNEKGLDLKIPMKLDFLLGRYHFRDNFDWDPNSEITPEEFATSLAADFGLGGEFAVIIAHSIREQLFHFMEQKLEIVPYLMHKERSSSSMKEIYRLLKANSTKNEYLNIISPLRSNPDETFEAFRDPNDLMDRSAQAEFVPALSYLSAQEFESILIKEEAQTRVSRRRRDGSRRSDRSRMTRFSSAN